MAVNLDQCTQLVYCFSTTRENNRFNQGDTIDLAMSLIRGYDGKIHIWTGGGLHNYFVDFNTYNISVSRQ